jgi:hypothetical protein
MHVHFARQRRSNCYALLLLDTPFIGFFFLLDEFGHFLEFFLVEFFVFVLIAEFYVG